MPEPRRFCVDCAHYSERVLSSAGMIVLPDLCNHPSLLNIVTKAPSLPDVNRRSGPCGPSGVLWEEKQAPELKVVK